MKKTPILLSACFLALCFFSQTIFAQTVSDDFNRPDTANQDSSSDPNAIGTNYTITGGTWRINNNRLRADSSGIMYENTLQTTNTGGASFSLTADVSAPGNTSGNRTGGLVFNFQDTDNYNLLRIGVDTDAPSDASRIQFVTVINGSNFFAETHFFDGLTVGNLYTLQVNSSLSSSSEFSYTLSDGMTELYSNTVTVGGSTLTDGYSGFVRSGGGAVFYDNYSMTVVIPEARINALLLGLLAGGFVLMRYRDKR